MTIITPVIPDICDINTLLLGENLAFGETMCTADGLAYAKITDSGLQVYDKAEKQVNENTFI